MTKVWILQQFYYTCTSPEMKRTSYIVGKYIFMKYNILARLQEKHSKGHIFIDWSLNVYFAIIHHNNHQLWEEVGLTFIFGLIVWSALSYSQVSMYSWIWCVCHDVYTELYFLILSLKQSLPLTFVSTTHPNFHYQALISEWIQWVSQVSIES